MKSRTLRDRIHAVSETELRRTTSESKEGAQERQRPRSDVEELVRNKVRSTALRRQRQDRLERWLLPTLLVVLLFGVWELAGLIYHPNPLFFSYPSKIAVALVAYASNGLWSDLAVSATEWAIGMAIALTAIPLGMVIGRSRRLIYALDPLINALYATPILALVPMFVIWFGLGIESKVAIVAVIAFFPLIITIIEGARTVDKVLVDAVRSFGATSRDVYLDVITPGILPFIVSGMRLAIRSGIIGVVIGEFLGAIGGIGYSIRVFASVFQTASYLAGVLILVGISVILNVLLKMAERRLTPWREALERG